MSEWLLVFFISGGQMSVSGTHPVDIPERCAVVALEKMRDFKLQYGDDISAFSVLCLPQPPEPRP